MAVGLAHVQETVRFKPVPTVLPFEVKCTTKGIPGPDVEKGIIVPEPEYWVPMKEFGLESSPSSKRRKSAPDSVAYVPVTVII